MNIRTRNLSLCYLLSLRPYIETPCVLRSETWRRILVLSGSRAWSLTPALILSLIVSLLGCDTRREPTTSRSLGLEELSENAARHSPDLVTIHRDSSGVAHVLGASDAMAAFGFGYAQAEDNFWQVEDNFIRALGRASEIYGQRSVMDDWVNRALEIPRLSQEEYAASPQDLKDLLDGFADGLNYFVDTSESKPNRLIDHFEPWYPLALVRYLYYQEGFLWTSGIGYADMREGLRRSESGMGMSMGASTGSVSRAVMSSAAGAVMNSAAGAVKGTDMGVAQSPDDNRLPPGEQGSNSWAIAPSRSSDGTTMLFINPHLPYFGESQVYEGHVMSRSGWNFSGYTRFGFPFPYVGFNEHLGWASTDNSADQADVFALNTIGDSNPTYSYGAENRPFFQWTDSIRVLTDDGPEVKTFSFLRSHQGPVMGFRGDQALVVRMARFEEPGWMDQWYAMTRSSTLVEFQSAASRLDMLFGNYLYADDEGHILFVYNAAIPVRDERFNWGGIVNGGNPDTEWKGYHSRDELPALLDPVSGWLQNCNQSPFYSTDNGNPDPRSFPDYMVRESDNARSRNARRILSSADQVSFDEWTSLSLDSYMIRAAETIPGLIDAFDQLKPGHPLATTDLGEIIDLFRTWDFRSSVSSVETTVFILWRESGEFSLSGLNTIRTHLVNADGTWRIPWGEFNRIQRPIASKSASSVTQTRQESGSSSRFQDDEFSIPSPGVPSWAGASNTLWSEIPPGLSRRYGIGGNSYVSVVSFGANVTARSLHVFGSSGNPSSPHFFDQAPRMTTGSYKDALLYPEEVQKNAARSYHPGG